MVSKKTAKAVPAEGATSVKKPSRSAAAKPAASKPVAKPSDSAQQSYTAIMGQISALQKQAEELRQSEKRDVIEKIKKAIAEYGLTASELGLARQVKVNGGARRSSPELQIRYRLGNDTWVGRGKRPAWITKALGEGKTLDDLRVQA